MIEALIGDVRQIRQMLVTLADKNKIYKEKVEELDACLVELKALEERREPIAPQIDILLRPEKWKKTGLLQSACQQLQKKYELLQAQAAEIEQGKVRDVQAVRQAARVAKQAQMKLVFVSLYQVDGLNMRKWASLLGSIATLAASRPVYQNESEAQAVIHTKEQKQNEGYVAVYITPGKETALRSENIAYFEHVSGRYGFQDGVLIKQN